MNVIIWLLVVIVVIAIAFWVTGEVPQPYQKWIRIVLAIVVIIYLLYSIGALPDADIRLRR